MVDTRALDEASTREQLRQRGLLDVLAKARQAQQSMRRASHDPLSWWTQDTPMVHDGLIQVELLEPLMMERRGLKPFRLQRCACRVPDLPRAEGSDYDYSLNHALTRISEQLELLRISHTGNAFMRYLVRSPGTDGDRLVRLGVLRDMA